jgi:hypothetical protein
MKNLFFFLLLSASFSLIGCGDDDEEPADFMTATIDGNGFEATTINGISDDSFGEELVLVLGTQSSNSQAIGLNIATSLGTGSNVVEADDLAITFSDNIISSSNGFFTEGTLNITRNDTTENILEGTFDFTATNDSDSTDIYNVTGGEFKVTYQ